MLCFGEEFFSIELMMLPCAIFYGNTDFVPKLFFVLFSSFIGLRKSKRRILLQLTACFLLIRQLIIPNSADFLSAANVFFLYIFHCQQQNRHIVNNWSNPMRSEPFQQKETLCHKEVKNICLHKLTIPIKVMVDINALCA